MRRLVASLCAFGALALLPLTASAQFVTTTFNGHVVANAADGFSPPTTPDFADLFQFYPNGPFGGGNLIGLPFKLTLTMDVSDPNSPSWDGVGIGSANNYTGGGTYYGGYLGGPGPLTAYLTINGQTMPFDDVSSIGTFFNGASTDGNTSPSELRQQAFYWLPCCGFGIQYFGLLLDLTSNTGVFGSDFTTQLPTLQAGTDFTIGYAAFYSFEGEYQNLGIENVNGAVFTPVPEPSTWVMMALGLIGLAGAATRRRLESTAIA